MVQCLPRLVLPCCRAGYYKLPYDMTSGLRHRQFNPLYILRKGAMFVREAADTISRRSMGESAATSVWLNSKLYPDYFMSTFHYRAPPCVSRVA
jgi:hypothetical protein